MKRQIFITKAGGFTLLEVLVVIVIVSILAGLAVMTLGDNRPRQLSREARKLHQLMQWLSEDAVISQHELGLVFDFPDYIQVRWDRTENTWVSVAEGGAGEEADGNATMAGGSLPVFIEPYLDIQGEGWQLGQETEQTEETEGEESQEAPDIIFYSSGENSVFTLSLTLPDRGDGQVIRSNGLGDFALLNSRDLR